MSQQSAKQFIEKLEKNQELTKRIQQAKSKQEVQSILKEKGFEFSEEEFKEAYKIIKGKELSEKELMKIAGGKGSFITSSFE